MGEEANGVLPDRALGALSRNGALTLKSDPLSPSPPSSTPSSTLAKRSSNAKSASQIQPASLDLTLGRRAFRVRASFLPSPTATVQERLETGLLMHEFDIADGAVFERGCVYLVELNERLSLPGDINAAANPKSSTGRIDVFVRLVTDYASAFDQAPAGYEGPLYVEICPRTFSIVARTGSSLNQLRLKQGRPALSDAETLAVHQQSPLIDGAPSVTDGLGLRVDLAPTEDGPTGWRARRHAGLIDVDELGALAPGDYFEPIVKDKGQSLILEPDEFYILASRERLCVPPGYAAEMTPISPGLGEFRVHYAGFFDPGFGYREGAAPSAKAVLEVRSHDAPFVLDDGQLVARLVYERMLEPPDHLYGEDALSNYQGQGLRLSKHFKAA
ncbi:MAG: 2'-deoxycytidine 5'-triphosphate deaminase [Pseudomonadota bacterium]